ncbi:MAG: hypothetical protein ACRDS1_04960 [Pseudonocardiaceae bacterium]
MVLSEPQRDRPQPSDSEERRRLDDELIGLDRDDPEVQAFAEHLDRAHRQRPGFTIEGYLSHVTDFAESANRAQGLRRAAAVLGVALVLIWVTAEAVAFIVGA